VPARARPQPHGPAAVLDRVREQVAARLREPQPVAAQQHALRGLLQLQPRASLGYIEEQQDSFTSSVSGLVPSQTVSLGQAKAGSQIAYRQKVSGGMVVEPSLLLEGIWNFHQELGLISVDDLVTTDDPRGRAEAGVTLYTGEGLSLGASVTYDGIGSSDYEAIGGRARVRMPLN